MSNVTEVQVRTAIANAITAASIDAGVVLTRERFCESDAEFIKLFVGLEPTNAAKGWLVTFENFSQREGDSMCEVTRTLSYTLERVYPYQDKRADNKNSHEVFKADLEALNTYLITNRNLGLGNTVYHLLLQNPQGYIVRRWGSGADQVITHYAAPTLAVEVTVSC